MKYDSVTHRWHLEVTDTADYGDIVSIYGSNEKAEIELKAQSRTIYRYIYSRIPLGNKDVIELALAKDTRYAPILKEALLAQLEYDIKSGGNDVDKQIGIDFKNNGALPRSRIKESQISIQAQQVLESASSDINLLYAGDFGIRLADTRYTDYGY